MFVVVEGDTVLQAAVQAVVRVVVLDVPAVVMDAVVAKMTFSDHLVLFVLHTYFVYLYRNNSRCDLKII